MKAGCALRRLARAVVILAALDAALDAGPARAGDAAYADSVYIDGAVYTQDPARPWVEAFAVAKGRYAAVGTTDSVRRLVGPATQVVKLAGRMVMPGLIDVHAVDGAGGELYDCLYTASASPLQIRQVLRKCVARAPAGTWISGGYWDSAFFARHPMASPRRWLDEVTGDRPVIWRDDSGHNVWVNTAALRLAGIDAGTADPTGGRYGREAGGSMPNGIAFEAAAEVIQAAVPDRTVEQLHQSVLYAQHAAHRLGIVGIKEADAATPTIAAYVDADHRGELSMYVAACISTLKMQDRPDKPLDFDAIERVHASYHSDLVATDFVKIYLDGVPTPARTAAMLLPYLPDASGAQVNGDLHVNPDVLAADIKELDRRGYTVKMHAAGDRSIRVGLDAIEAARRANPSGHLHHELAHAGFVSAEDLDRFAGLGVVADLSPVIWYPSPIIDAVREAVGERADHYFPIRSLVASGALLAAGSDWPSVVSSMDPWGGIQAMVTRSDPYHHSSRTLWPEESITLADALRIYTLGGALALKRDGDTGSIIAGKSADFIVLNQNLFSIPASAISGTRVRQTVFHGRVVYEMVAGKHRTRDRAG